jgi:hypothetical protein
MASKKKYIVSIPKFQNAGKASNLPKPRSKNYDPLYTIKPQATESTAVRNLPKQDKKVVEKAIAKKEAERRVVAQKIQANPLLTQAQKNEILLDPRKLDENVNLAYEKGPDIVQQVEPQSTVSRAWEYITNPMTAAEYAISGGGAENMPRNINEMRMAGIDPGVVAGRNLVGNTLNYTTNLFDAGDKVVRNLGEGNYGTAALEAMRFLPGARMSTGLGKQASKYLTTQTPLRNTYKVLGKDTKFYNPGEKPNWLRGYQQQWDPQIADLTTLSDYTDKFLNTVLSPKNIKTLNKASEKIRNKYKPLINDLSEKIELTKKSGNTEIIDDINKQLDKLLFNRTQEISQIHTDLFKNKIPDNPFSQRLGSGSFGSVYEVPNINRTVKLGRIPTSEDVSLLVEKAKGLDKSNIAIPTRVEKLPSGEYVTVMNKVDPITTSYNENPPTLKSYNQLIKDVKKLQDRDIYLDFNNKDNIVYNPDTRKFNIYDLNTTGYIPKYGDYDATGKSVEQLLIDNQVIPKDYKLTTNIKSKETVNFKKSTKENAPIKSGLGSMDMSRYEIANPDYFTQLLDTYTSRQLSPSSKKFYKGLIESVKRQNGIVTERQYQELQRLKTGNFNYGKKAYEYGGLFNYQYGGGYLPSDVSVVYLPEGERSYYDPMLDTIYLNPNALEDELNHEMAHAWQNRQDGFRSDPYSPKVLPSAVATDEQAASYYNRKGDDVDRYLNNLRTIVPEFGGHTWNEDVDMFIPEQVKYDKVVDPLMYNDASTLEGEAEIWSQIYGRPPLGIKEYGGLFNYQSGGRKPIYTNDPNDPRIQAYIDSASQYNLGETELKRFFRRYPPRSDGKIRSLKDLDRAFRENSYEPRKNRLYDTHRFSISQGSNTFKNLRKIESTFKRTGILPTDFWSNEGFMNYRFKKPVQPVYYKKVEDSRPKPNIYDEASYNKSYPPIYTSDPNDPRIGMYTEAGNQILYKKPTKSKKSTLKSKSKPVDKVVSTPEPVPVQIENTPPIQMPLRDKMVLPLGRSYQYEATDGSLEGGKTTYGQFEKVVDPRSGKIRYVPTGKKSNFTTLQNPTFERGGEIIKDQEGQRKYPGKVTEIQGNLMATDGYGNIPLYVIPDVGEPRVVMPNTGVHEFKGATKFVEYPIKNTKVPKKLSSKEFISIKSKVNKEIDQHINWLKDNDYPVEKVEIDNMKKSLWRKHMPANTKL